MMLLLLLVRFNWEKRDFPVQHVAAKKQKRNYAKEQKSRVWLGVKRFNIQRSTRWLSPHSITYHRVRHDTINCLSLIFRHFMNAPRCQYGRPFAICCRDTDNWFRNDFVTKMNGGKCIMITHLYKRNGCGFAVFHLVFFVHNDKISGATFKWPTFGAVFIFPFKWILFQLAYVEWFHEICECNKKMVRLWCNWFFPLFELNLKLHSHGIETLFVYV